ncbi:hypothetical protein RRG08_020571 [Elysia crispata]|uniref:Uncharacterized protein n=1 Tax=Elysia crispata TaxID=231223 RepID=A0AAE1A625_9GAST|nr:hypothetical protein RRG08_020571 [Elysia crispata]
MILSFRAIPCLMVDLKEAHSMLLRSLRYKDRIFHHDDRNSVTMIKEHIAGLHRTISPTFVHGFYSVQKQFSSDD